jgi:hypothetical protein
MTKTHKDNSFGNSDLMLHIVLSLLITSKKAIWGERKSNIAMELEMKYIRLLNTSFIPSPFSWSEYL